MTKAVPPPLLATPVAARGTQPMSLMMGLPDDGMVQMRGFAKDGQLQINVPGAASFLPFLEPTARARLKPVYFGPGMPLIAGPNPSRRPLVNNVADPDKCSRSLQMLAAVTGELKVPVFNAASAVLDTTRDRVSEKLADIPGVVVPKTIRARLKQPSDLLGFVERAGMALPVIVRIAGTHGGTTTRRVDTVDQVADALSCMPWGGHDVYISQYADYVDTDGRYRKQRLALVGDEVFLRHHIVADEWHVHAQERDAAALREESSELQGFAQQRLPALRRRLDAIRDAMGLDYFGIDCSLRPDGTLLLFEANAAMNFLVNSAPTPNIWAEPISHIRSALQQLLANPDRWRTAGRHGQ